MRRVRHHDLDESLPALIVTYGMRTHKHWPLDRDLLLLGRGRGCNLALMSPEVASVHCIIARLPTGWSIRDCGSQVGTHVNGSRIDEAVLRDEDNLQIGPFCFRVHLPAGSSAAPGALDDLAVLRLRRSRRNLALLALALRRRLRGERRRQQSEVEQTAHAFQERWRAYEERAARLAQAERELSEDREILEQEFTALQERVVRTEEELARRQTTVEADLQARWRQMQQRHQETEPLHIRRLQEEAASEEGRRLELRRQELSHFAQHLARTHQRLLHRDDELTRKQRELEDLWSQLLQGLESISPPPAQNDSDCNRLCQTNS